VSQLLECQGVYRASDPDTENSPTLAAIVTAAATDFDTAACCQADWRDRDRFPANEAMIELHNASLRDFSAPGQSDELWGRDAPPMVAPVSPDLADLQSV
jgi:hypothetical protein